MQRLAANLAGRKRADCRFRPCSEGRTMKRNPGRYRVFRDLASCGRVSAPFPVRCVHLRFAETARSELAASARSFAKGPDREAILPSQAVDWAPSITPPVIVEPVSFVGKNPDDLRARYFLERRKQLRHRLAFFILPFANVAGMVRTRSGRTTDIFGRQRMDDPVDESA